jgi:hypothetical protein
MISFGHPRFGGTPSRASYSVAIESTSPEKKLPAAIFKEIKDK